MLQRQSRWTGPDEERSPRPRGLASRRDRSVYSRCRGPRCGICAHARSGVRKGAQPRACEPSSEKRWQTCQRRPPYRRSTAARYPRRQLRLELCPVCARQTRALPAEFALSFSREWERPRRRQTHGRTHHHAVSATIVSLQCRRRPLRRKAQRKIAQSKVSQAKSLS